MFLSPNEEHDSLRQSVIWLDNQPQQFDGFSQLFGPPLMVTISHHFTGVFFGNAVHPKLFQPFHRNMMIDH
jgi:hypothetical protein